VPRRRVPSPAPTWQHLGGELSRNIRCAKDVVPDEPCDEAVITGPLSAHIASHLSPRARASTARWRCRRLIARSWPGDAGRRPPSVLLCLMTTPLLRPNAAPPKRDVDPHAPAIGRPISPRQRLEVVPWPDTYTPRWLLLMSLRAADDRDPRSGLLYTAEARARRRSPGASAQTQARRGRSAGGRLLELADHAVVGTLQSTLQRDATGAERTVLRESAHLLTQTALTSLPTSVHLAAVPMVSLAMRARQGLTAR